ncbi:ubiquinol-cytochrome c reductase iron-sulfur subunit [Hansschlegelia zhihuaiae]|uniref:Ubiquinol-cytochrome c reductase iron-sulfur subunit n=1 Tax=Hansschlegelia zhihuaiae TaxID=405005 RepID=A0A4Q0MJ19_9HYPH|nr:ubiquinol-cytochrome c reductase iron-sulfur subunit [Hansschlegelia zhihuaiae]RXF73528.1 ubiquinol-cytochrome c reductase iron-sulfur subunit [Hansschlegelia zhihuaiae]
MTATHDAHDPQPVRAEPNRRDFLYLTTGAAGAIGAGFLAWPFIAQMNPDAASLALASTEVDVSQIAEGQAVTVKWRGKPVFVWNRTKAQVEEAKKVELAQLPDKSARNENLPSDAPATDVNRAAKDKENWLIVVGVCTHLGCVPISNSGDFGGFLCPCHGSHYDSAGRIRRGPAPENLHVPPYAFEGDTKIKIG